MRNQNIDLLSFAEQKLGQMEQEEVLPVIQEVVVRLFLSI